MLLQNPAAVWSRFRYRFLLCSSLRSAHFPAFRSIVWSQPGHWESLGQLLNRTTLCVFRLPTTRIFIQFPLPSTDRGRAVCLCSTFPSIGACRPMYKCRSRAFYRLYTNPHIYDHPAKCRRPCPPCYCLTIRLDTSFRQARCMCRFREFCSQTIHPRSESHRSNCISRIRVSYPHNIALHRLSRQSMSPCLDHVTSRPSTDLHISHH